MSDSTESSVIGVRPLGTCPCGFISNEVITECPECGMSENDWGYYDESGLIPEKPLCFD